MPEILKVEVIETGRVIDTYESFEAENAFNKALEEALKTISGTSAKSKARRIAKKVWGEYGNDD